jgi:hypothetical protein
MNTPTPGALARFQDAFALALRAPEAAPPNEVAALVSRPAFAVYRNTVMKGCIDALQANYPAVTRVVGEEWFRAAAVVYAHETPPSNPTLLNYGADFAGFLGRFGPAADLPYLPDVARLDRFWTEAHVAPDEDRLDPATIAGLAPEALAGIVLVPHASARWAWFEGAPAYTIWSRNRGDGDPGTDMDWRAEGALVIRPHVAVEWIALDAAGCAFLDACAAGHALDEAARRALDADRQADLAVILYTLLGVGAFSRARAVQD